MNTQFSLRRISFLLWAFLAAVWFAGCEKKEGCTDPASTNYDVEAEVDDGSCTYPHSMFSLHFTHKVGNQPFAFNTTYQDSTGRNYFFRNARFHFSSPYLKTAFGSRPIGKYLHVMADESDYAMTEVSPGNYTGFSFDVGVDSVANHSDPTTYPPDHPLSILNPNQDHWAWNVGYVFLKIEGYIDTTANMTGQMDKFFFFHIATDQLLTNVDLPLNFTVEGGQDYAFRIIIDWAQAFKGIDLLRESTQTTDNVPLATQVMNNLVSGIKVNE
jgi:hypothetical protein